MRCKHLWPDGRRGPILRGELTGLGAAPRTYLPHRDEGYGLSSATVHCFSCSGTDLHVTVDNGISARTSVRLARRSGIAVSIAALFRKQLPFYLVRSYLRLNPLRLQLPFVPK